MLEGQTLLLSSAYLPNIQYISKFLSGNPVVIETQETYQKQSFRNRSVIYGANGPLNLVIPVKRPQGNTTKSCDVLIDYGMPWNEVHWKAIVSAYKNSPFFEIFELEVKPWFSKKMKYLLDWNTYILEELFKIADIQHNFTLSKEYILPTDPNCIDYRDSLHPKKRMQKNDLAFNAPDYYQVFKAKHGFQANTSFIDLLFNEGPQALSLCRNSIKKG